MTQILAFSGKKQSGKNTACNWIIGNSMASLGIVKGAYKINAEGKLWISDLFGDDTYQGIFDITRNSQGMKDFLHTHLNEYVRLYSFADPIKQDICINILGLTYEQVYGTDEEKNSLTHLKWEDMPGVTTEKTPEDVVNKEVAGRLGKYYEKIFNGMIYHAPGPMTAREVMQFVGTEIFRKIYGDVWVDATIRRIEKDKPALALICDNRFPNEVYGVQKYGGVVVRLTRNPFPDNKHESEVALDKDRFNWDNFDFIVENDNMSIKEQNESVFGIMKELNLIIE